MSRASFVINGYVATMISLDSIYEQPETARFIKGWVKAESFDVVAARLAARRHRVHHTLRRALVPITQLNS